MIRTNIYLVQRYFIWIKQILFHLNKSFLKIKEIRSNKSYSLTQSKLFSESTMSSWSTPLLQILSSFFLEIFKNTPRKHRFYIFLIFRIIFSFSLWEIMYIKGSGEKYYFRLGLIMANFSVLNQIDWTVFWIHTINEVDSMLKTRKLLFQTFFHYLR